MAAAIAVSIPGAYAESYTWTGDIDGDWGKNGNWDSTPNFVAGTELIFHADGAGNLSTFLGSASRIIGGLTFNDNCDGEIIVRTYSNDSGSSGTNRLLYFNNGTEDAYITVAAGASGDILVAPGGGRTILKSDLVITHNGTGTLTYHNNNWIDDEDNGYSVIKNGDGTLVYGVSGWKLGGGLVVNEGRVKVQRNDGFGTGALTMTGGGLSALGSEDRTFANDFNLGGSLILGDETDNGFLQFSSGFTGTLTGNTILDVRGGGVALNSAIGDGGSGYSLTKTGASALALGAANTFSGGVTVQEGRLRLGHDEALAAGSTLTMTGGALSSHSGAARSLANDFSFSGAITLGHVSDNGLLTLSGVGTLTGDTTLNTVVNTTLSAAIGQSGGDWSLTKTGPGSLALTLNQVNTFAGGLIVQQGILRVNNSEARLGTGTVTLDGGTLQYIGKSANATINRDMTVDASNGMIDLDTGDRFVDWAGKVSGSGTLTKIGSGLLKLSGNNDHTGDIVVAAGPLEINGTHTGGGLITVQSGATLGGTGTASQAQVESGGILTGGAGGTTGTLSFDDDLTMNAGSLWLVDLVQNDNGNSDRVDVGGTLTIADAEFTPNFTESFTLGNRFVIASYDSLVGAFKFNGNTWNEGEENFIGGGNYMISYSDGGNFITLTAVPEPASLLSLAALLIAGLLPRRRRRVADALYR